jgi:hypothetical protein
MVTLHLAPIKQNERPIRDSFLAPNGTYYALRFPTLETAKELVSLGVNRIVLPATHFEVSLRGDIADVLFDADVEIIYRRAA